MVIHQNYGFRPELWFSTKIMFFDQNVVLTKIVVFSKDVRKHPNFDAKYFPEFDHNAPSKRRL